MIDSHCHLDAFSKIELDKIIEESKENRMEAIIASGFSLESSKKAVEISKIYENFVFPTVGVGPQIAMKMKNKEWEKISDKLLGSSVAIGEIGLDYKWAKTIKGKNLQKDCFLFFLNLAKEIDLPVVIHSRDSYPDIFKILEEASPKKVLLHCFSGNFEDAKIASSRKYWISFPPIQSRAREKIAERSKELNCYLVVETDSPYIGKRPIDCFKAIKLIADARKEKIENIEKETTENAKRFFGILQ